jgi:hypothetical protein
MSPSSISPSKLSGKTCFRRSQKNFDNYSTCCSKFFSDIFRSATDTPFTQNRVFALRDVWFKWKFKLYFELLIAKTYEIACIFAIYDLFVEPRLVKNVPYLTVLL